MPILDKHQKRSNPSKPTIRNELRVITRGSYKSISDSIKIVGSSIECSALLKSATIEGIDRL